MTSAARRPRDEAAAIARQVLWLQRNMSRGSRDDWAADLRTFIEKYDGTPTALVARVELIIETLPIPQQVDTAERFAYAHEGTVAGARALYHVRLWNQFFPMRQGHRGGWVLATYPEIARIEFTNKATHEGERAGHRRRFPGGCAPGENRRRMACARDC